MKMIKTLAALFFILISSACTVMPYGGASINQPIYRNGQQVGAVQVSVQAQAPVMVAPGQPAAAGWPQQQGAVAAQYPQQVYVGSGGLPNNCPAGTMPIAQGVCSPPCPAGTVPNGVVNQGGVIRLNCQQQLVGGYNNQQCVPTAWGRACGVAAQQELQNCIAYRNNGYRGYCGIPGFR